MLYYYSEAADQCRALEADVFSTSEFAESASAFLAVRINGEERGTAGEPDERIEDRPNVLELFEHPGLDLLVALWGSGDMVSGRSWRPRLKPVYPTLCFVDASGKIMGVLMGVYPREECIGAVREAALAFQALKAGAEEGAPSRRLELAERFYRIQGYDRAAKLFLDVAAMEAGADGAGPSVDELRRARVLGALALRLDAAWRWGNFEAEKVTARSTEILNGVLGHMRARDATREESEALGARILQYRPIVLEQGGARMGTLYNILDPDALVELIRAADDLARLGPSPRPDQPAREKLRIARVYSRLANRERALPFFEQLSRDAGLSPDERAEVLANFGWGLLEKEDNARAQEVFQTFLGEFNSPSKGGEFRPQVFISISALAYSEGKDQEAIARLVDVVDQYKGTTWAVQAYDLLSRIDPDRYPPAKGPVSAERRGGTAEFIEK